MKVILNCLCKLSVAAHSAADEIENENMEREREQMTFSLNNATTTGAERERERDQGKADKGSLLTRDPVFGCASAATLEYTKSKDPITVNPANIIHTLNHTSPSPVRGLHICFNELLPSCAPPFAFASSI